MDRRRSAVVFPRRVLADGDAPCPGLVSSSKGLGLAKLGKLVKFENFWRSRSRLYQNEILQENMRLTAFFKFYKICNTFAPLQSEQLRKKSV